MRPELQAKLLQHLNKKKADKGFTLVELLVVIVIVGILTAIALPSFMNQTAKAKQAEAKQTVQSILKAQQSKRAERNGFVAVVDDLALGTIRGTGTTYSTVSYNYTIAAPDSTTATTLATSKDTAVKSYSGAVQVRNQRTGTNADGTPILEVVMDSVTCEANSAGTSALTVPTFATSAPFTPDCTTSAKDVSVK